MYGKINLFYNKRPGGFMKEKYEQYRDFLKDSIRLFIDFSKTDQSMGIEPPPIEKPYDKDSVIINLPKPSDWDHISKVDIVAAIMQRKSHRKYLNEPISIEELSFLLWATQGTRKKFRNSALRTVPSAGNRHALETYVVALNIAGLNEGVYRYLPLEHNLLLEFNQDNLSGRIIEATLLQSFAGAAAAVLVWTAIPYRMEWRYGLASYKVIALDAGHVCQNLYIACEAIACGTCAIAAYNQELMDELIRVDGKEEFTIYLAPVGKV
jgi:SagB-type dehydrogenase family enzyme